MEGVNGAMQQFFELIVESSDESEGTSESEEEVPSSALLHYFSAVREYVIDPVPVMEVILEHKTAKMFGALLFFGGFVGFLVAESDWQDGTFVIPAALMVAGFLVWVASTEISVHAMYDAGNTATDMARHVARSLALLVCPPSILLEGIMN